MSYLKVRLRLNWPLLHKFTVIGPEKKKKKCSETILTHDTVKGGTRLYQPDSCQTCLEGHLVPQTKYTPIKTVNQHMALNYTLIIKE